MCGGRKKLAPRPVLRRENTLAARQQVRTVAAVLNAADRVRARRERQS